MTITANDQFLNASNIQEYTNHRFMKFDHMLNLPRFQQLCHGAKLLYTYMLDRLHLSEKNSSRFSDERGLFIFFSYDEIMEKIGCAKAKAAGLLAELEKFGLIFRARCTGSARKKIYLPVVKLTELEQAQIQVAEKQTEQHRETLLHEIAERYQWSESDVAAVIRKMFAGFEQTYGVGFTPEMVNQGTAPQSAEFDFQTQESSEIELNMGTENCIDKIQLLKLAEENDFSFEPDISKEKIAKILMQQIGAEALADKCSHMGVSSYNFQQKFGITNADVKLLAQTGFLKVTGTERYRSFGRYRYASLYSVFQYFQLTPTEVQKQLKQAKERKQAASESA